MSIRVVVSSLLLSGLVGLSACGGDSQSRKVDGVDGGDVSEPEPDALSGDAGGGDDDAEPEPGPGMGEPDEDAGPSQDDEVPVDDDDTPDDDADDDLPTVVGDMTFEATTDEDTPLEVLFADYGVPTVDIDLDAVTVQPQHGTVDVTEDGVTYTPDPDYFGDDLIEYTLPDGSVITIVLMVAPVNDDPSATDDAYSAPGGATYDSDGSVLDNDTDIDSEDLEASLVSPPQEGNLTLNPDGTFRYEHTGAPGEDSFIYEACDGDGACSVATVVLTVSDSNEPPVAEDDEYSVQRGTTLNVAVPGVLENDSDPDGDPLSVTVDTGPTSGSLTLEPDGSFSYTHDGSAGAADSFIYEACDPDGACDTATVTLNVSDGAVNNAPLAISDNYVVDEGGMLTGNNVLDNDSDPEGTGLTASLDTDVNNGSLTLNPDGTFTYIHDGSETPADSFIYEACDEGGACSTATASITVVPVNDSPTAEDDEVTVDEGAEVDGNVLDNDVDPDGDALTVSALTDPENGTVVLNADGSFTYTHDGEESTEDSFTYEACDPDAECASATVIITVGPVNDPPVAEDDSYSGTEGVLLVSPEPVTANDSDAEGGTLTVNTTPIVAPTDGMLTLNADGSFTYAANASAPDSFVYEVCDDQGACDQATVDLAFFNSVPVALPDAAAVSEGGVVVIPVMDNDSDPGGDPITLDAITVLPSVGSIQPNIDGTVTYTLNCAGSAATQDTFRYRICDTEGACATALVTVDLEFFDVALDDLVGNRLASGVVPSPNVPIVASDVEDENGRFAIDAGGNFNFLPPPGARAPETFELSYEMVNAAPATGCEVSDTVLFTLGPNAVWHVDPNKLAPQFVRVATPTTPPPEPPPEPPSGDDGREKFPNGGGFDSYAFPALGFLSGADVQEGDIIVVYALGAASPPAAAQPAGVFPSTIPGTVNLPEGVALVGEAATLPGALSALGFPDVVFPDPAFATGGTPTIANSTSPLVIEENGAADALTTVVTGVNLQSFSSHALTRSGSFADASGDRFNTVRIDDVQFAAGCGECGDAGIALWNVENLDLIDTTVVEADVGWLLSAVGTTTNTGSIIQLAYEVGVLIEGPGLKRSAQVLPAGVAGPLDMIFTGDPIVVDASLYDGVDVIVYDGNVNFWSDVELGDIGDNAVFVGFSNGVVDFEGAVNVVDAGSQGSLCQGSFCCAAFAVCAQATNGLVLEGGGNITSRVGGIGASQTEYLSVSGVTMDVGADFEDVSGIRSTDVHTVQASNNVVDGAFDDAILIEAGTSSLNLCQKGCLVAAEPQGGTLSGPFRWTRAELTGNSTASGAIVDISGIRAQQGTQGVICIDSQGNDLAEGEVGGIYYGNVLFDGDRPPFEVIDPAGGDAALSDNDLDNVLAANTTPSAIAADESAISFVSQCSMTQGNPLTIVIEDIPGNGDNIQDNEVESYPCSNPFVQATGTFANGQILNMTQAVNWALQAPDPTGSVLNFNELQPGSPGSITILADYQDNFISPPITDSLAVTILDNECIFIE